MQNQKPKRGGARKGAGRKPLPAERRPVAVTVRVQRAVREKFAAGAESANKSQAAFFANLVQNEGGWNRAEFIAGHAAGAAWWTSAKSKSDNPKPKCPYNSPEQRALWERGFDWGESDAEDCYYADGAI